MADIKTLVEDIQKDKGVSQDEAFDMILDLLK